MSDDRSSESFLGRWSRRKRALPTAREEEDAKTQAALAAERERALPQTVAPQPVEPPPDLPSVETLTPDSDYTRFMQPDVPIASRNAAMKKLFSDPHFNVMDGLDIYIDDYTKEDPIPMAMLRDLAQSKMLGLFKEEEEQEAAQKAAREADERQALANQFAVATDDPAQAAAQAGAEALSEAPADGAGAEPYNPAAPANVRAAAASTPLVSAPATASPSARSSTAVRPDSA